MGIERDEQEERLARIEHIHEQLRHEMHQFTELHRRTIEDARLTVERAAASRGAANRARRAAHASNRTAAERVAQARKSKA